MKPSRTHLVLLVAALSFACGPPQTPSVSSAMSSRQGVADEDCDPNPGEGEVMLDMSAVDRATLESESLRGIVAVKFQGCSLDVLTDCLIDGRYELTEGEVERDTITANDMTILPNILPLFVPGYSAQLVSGNMLRLEYAIRGRRTADVSAVTRANVAPGCSDATHVIRSLAIGASRLSIMEMTSAQAGVAEGAVEASHRNSRNERQTVGDLAACSSSDTAGCNAAIRADLVPLR